MANTKSCGWICALAFATVALADPTTKQDPQSRASCIGESCDAKGDSLLQKVAHQKLSVEVTEDDEYEKVDAFAHASRVQAQRANKRDSARARLMSQVDFKQLDSLHFRAWDASQDCHANADAAFTHFMDNTHFILTPAEQDVYRQNFDDHVEDTCKKEGFEAGYWTQTIQEAFQDEACVMTEAEAASLNADTASTYTVTAHSQGSTCMSVRHMNSMLGRDTDVQHVSLAQEERQRAHMTLIKNNKTNPPTTFASDEAWAQCTSVILRDHNQGTCGSCWAFAGTLVLDSRICIMTNGAFQSQLSRTVTSVCRPGDGCQGGWEHFVWSYSAENAIPVGGDDGCVPYFAHGSGVDHFTETQGEAACPTQCVSREPPMVTPTWQDLDFQTQGSQDYTLIMSSPTTTTLKVNLQNELMEHGPVANGVYVGSAFQAWNGGIFDSCPTGGANHAVAIIGWGQSGQDIFWTLKNSWGNSWGPMDGKMTVASCIITDFSWPGDFTGAMSGWDIDPTPTGPTPPPTPAPPTPTPATPTPTVTPEWTITGDGCEAVAGEPGCVASKNFGTGDYGNNEACMIHNFPQMEIAEFNTEQNYDKLNVNGQDASGAGVAATSSLTLGTVNNIVWGSDGSVVNSGWKLCATAPAEPTAAPTAAPTQAPTAAPTTTPTFAPTSVPGAGPPGPPGPPGPAGPPR